MRGARLLVSASQRATMGKVWRGERWVVPIEVRIGSYLFVAASVVGVWLAVAVRNLGCENRCNEGAATAGFVVALIGLATAVATAVLVRLEQPYVALASFVGAIVVWIVALAFLAAA